jgi:8-oxo-dGTP pyrophosphatase MutT (NUDIX family)
MIWPYTGDALREALEEAGASPASARKAAEEVAEHFERRDSARVDWFFFLAAVLGLSVSFSMVLQFWPWR